MDKKGLLVLFIIIVVLLVVAVLFAVLYKPVKHKMLSKKTSEVYGKKIYNIARDNDYLLINNFDYKLRDGTKFHIDHILFGEKFIYVILDEFIEGGVDAIENDNDWIRFSLDKKTEKKYLIRNPLKKSKRVAHLFTRATLFDSSFIISIVLINDDCVVEKFTQTSTDNFLSTPKKVSKLIQQIESRDIRPINQKELEAVVRDIATKLNANYKKEN